MSIDPTLIELAARIERASLRIERLETLEYETVAFPAGAGFTLICNVRLAGPAASVTLCPVGIIPGSFRHLWLVIAAGQTIVIADKMELNINADFAAHYQYLTREEVPFGVPVGATDTEAFSPGTFALDTKWRICHAAGFEPDPTPTTPVSSQCSCLVQLPDYSDSLLLPYQSFYSFANFDKTPVSPFVPSVDQGGGMYNILGGLAPITSITVTAGGGGTFAAESEFSLYGF